MSSREWNSGAYHRLSDPQFQWGLSVLERLPLRGDETVLDAGCGSGRVTAALARRLPRGRVIAVDVSENMLQAAREFLSPTFGTQVQFVLADMAELPLANEADCVFSTAAFHWVADHDRLFRSLYGALRQGGIMVAQCGGGPNLVHIYGRAKQIRAELSLDRYFDGWVDPVHSENAEDTAARLLAAGFTDVKTWTNPASVTLPDADTYREFLRNVILRAWLARLPADAAETLLDKVVLAGEGDSPAFTLDYWRLNIEAAKPGAASL